MMSFWGFLTIMTSFLGVLDYYDEFWGVLDYHDEFLGVLDYYDEFGNSRADFFEPGSRNPPPQGAKRPGGAAESGARGIS